MRSQVGVSLLVSGVLGDEVKVFSSDNEGTVHLGGNNGAGQDAAADRDHTSEGAFLVCICTVRIIPLDVVRISFGSALTRRVD